MKKLRLFALTPGLMALLLCCSQARVQGQEIHIDFDQVTWPDGSIQTVDGVEVERLRVVEQGG